MTLTVASATCNKVYRQQQQPANTGLQHLSSLS